jgi:hypothetical protein
MAAQEEAQPRPGSPDTMLAVTFQGIRQVTRTALAVGPRSGSTRSKHSVLQIATVRDCMPYQLLEAVRLPVPSACPRQHVLLEGRAAAGAC